MFMGCFLVRGWLLAVAYWAAIERHVIVVNLINTLKIIKEVGLVLLHSQLEIMIIRVWHHHPLTSYQTVKTNACSQRKNVFEDADEERRATSCSVRHSFTSLSQTSHA